MDSIKSSLISDENGIPKMMWKPPIENNCRMEEFRLKVQKKFGITLECYHDLWKWSTENYSDFWEMFWSESGIIYSQICNQVVDKKLSIVDNPEWFAGARLNYAENLLKFNDDKIAVYSTGEQRPTKTYTYKELRKLVSKYAAALRSMNIKTGDRVVGYIPNCVEALVAMLAAASIGAIYSSTSPDFGVMGVLDRFQQIEPSVIFSVDAVWYKDKTHNHLDKLKQVVSGLPTLKHVVIIPFVNDESKFDISEISKSMMLSEFLSRGSDDEDITFEQLPFNHPLFVMYSSGTTGPPKCMVHSAGGTLIQHMKEHILHGNMDRNDILLFYTTTGWMMWNWLVGALSTGGSIVLYDGSPFHPKITALWELVESIKITILGTSAKCLSMMEEYGMKPNQTHKIDSLHTMLSTGSPLAPHQYDFVYTHVKTDLVMGSISGGTDIISCFMGQNFAVPVYKGEVQENNLGMAMSCFDETGKPVYNEPGELVCTTPFPCMPTHFWNDEDNVLYRNAYFAKFPGVWSHGDYCIFNSKTNGIVMLGRSDATLNPNGVRFGTTELYGIVERAFGKDVEDCVAVAQRSVSASSFGERVILFVKMMQNALFSEDLAKKIKSEIRRLLSPRHVPALVLETKDIPYTISGKKVEMAVAKMVAGGYIAHSASFRNPESLELFKNIPELQGF
ncbi:acetoacetyl-CoA synthetase-like [Styela clava]